MEAATKAGMDNAGNQTIIEADALVVGAGVVGLAVARAFARQGAQTILLEAEAAFGTGISSRSSEVIHAGIYYAPNSLKARLCVAGNRALYAYCREHGVPFRQTGKLIVAAEEADIARLQGYWQHATANGVLDLEWLSGDQVRQREPALRSVGGLFSPSTGIIDSHALMSALLLDFERAGGVYVANSPVIGGEVIDGATVVMIGGSDPCQIVAKNVINAAGMGAQSFARSLRGFPAHHIPGLYYAVGHYFGLQGKPPFRHLVYPVAVAGGLGVHLTLDLAGHARFGPDVAWRDKEDYSFDDGNLSQFYRAIRRYWPDLPEGSLQAAYTGIRPKLYGPTQPDQDFLICGPVAHGIPGLIHLFGIESPGLTASLALADHVLALCNTN